MKLFRYNWFAVVMLLAVSGILVAGILDTDRDHDGVSDRIDQCLNTEQVSKIDPAKKYAAVFTASERSSQPRSVAVDQYGCALDSDHDGVADYKDYCPDDASLAISAGVHTNGCPRQSDGDGTPDYRDQCPDTPSGVKADAKGCPAAFLKTHLA